jgi:hypothetical protein
MIVMMSILTQSLLLGLFLYIYSSLSISCVPLYYHCFDILSGFLCSPWTHSTPRLLSLHPRMIMSRGAACHTCFRDAQLPPRDWQWQWSRVNSNDSDIIRHHVTHASSDSRYTFHFLSLPHVPEVTLALH